MSEGGHIDQVGVLGMDAHLGDTVGILQTTMRPGLPPVGRLVDPVAMRDVAPDGGLAHADVEDVGIGRGDGDGADGRGGEKAVGDILPIRPAIGGLPDPTGAGPKVEGRVLGRMSRHRHHATTPVWPH